MAVSKRLRFEILRRDNHACRYCGAAAPDATLTIDHVVPVALGGTDDPANLVTACKDCNSGKSASPPDAPVVADVSADALRWGRAMAEAAAIMLRDHDARAAQHQRFIDAWNAWTHGFGKELFPIDPSWQQSVDQLLAAGLPMDVLLECVDIAIGMRHVKLGNHFRYMCGIAWRKVTEMQEMAATMLAADEPGFRQCGHIQPPGPCSLCAAGVPPRRGRHAQADTE